MRGLPVRRSLAGQCAELDARRMMAPEGSDQSERREFFSTLEEERRAGPFLRTELCPAEVVRSRGAAAAARLPACSCLIRILLIPRVFRRAGAEIRHQQEPAPSRRYGLRRPRGDPRSREGTSCDELGEPLPAPSPMFC